jgi:hypothetical protein
MSPLQFWAAGPFVSTRGCYQPTVLVRPADDCGPMRSDASRPVDPLGAGDSGFGVVGRGGLADNRRPVGSDASGSVDAVGAGGGVALMGEGERAERNHDGECNVFHSNELRVSQVRSSSRTRGTAPLADTSRYFAVLQTKFTPLD